MEVNVTSIVLNLRASFFWEPTFSNQTKSIFINWAQHHKTDAVKVIVAGKRLKFIFIPFAVVIGLHRFLTNCFYIKA